MTLFQLGAEDLGKAGAEQPAANEILPPSILLCHAGTPGHSLPETPIQIS
jgi:hypothetical protein